MSRIIDKLKAKEFFCCLTGVTEETVKEAEQALEVSFSKEYRDYLFAFGLASFQGHELTGITKSKRLNVVDVTKKARQYTANVPADWYVIEETNIDGIVIWQSPECAIYQTQPGHTPTMICKSLSEYIDL